MKKIGLFYATKADKTTWVAEKIQKEFGKDRIEVVPIEQAWQNDFAAYDCLIVTESGCLPRYLKETGLRWSVLLLPKDTLSNVPERCVVIGGAVWSSIWIINPSKRKRESGNGANR